MNPSVPAAVPEAPLPPVRRAATPLRAWEIWANPIFRRYVRARLRPQALAASLIVTIVLAGFLFFMSRTIAIYQGGMALIDAERMALIPLLVLQSLLLFILGTGQVAGGMTAESDEGVLDYQRLTPMTPLAKVVGYLFGLPIREHIMVLVCLPFTAWSLWRGGVPFSTWAPLYAVFYSSALLYHLTGLVAGTVVRNKRWAFLWSMGIVIVLYTVMPQLDKVGFVFFKYLTMTPVVIENLPHLMPRSAGSGVAFARSMLPEVRFFNLKFSETVFTFFAQAGLIVTFFGMLLRRWRHQEAHLMGKMGAMGFFVWLQILLLGSALPLIETGQLFPSRQLRRFPIGHVWKPDFNEAALMIAVYGTFTLLVLVLLAGVITPKRERQIEGLRRARKLGLKRLAVTADETSGFFYTATLVLIGAAGWFVFADGLVDSAWFPGRALPAWTFLTFLMVLTNGALGFQTVLEALGGRWAFLAAVFVGAVPVMAGMTVGAAADRLQAIAVWLGALSPLSGPVYSIGGLLPTLDFSATLMRSVPRAFWFWQGVMTLTTIWLCLHLWRVRRERAALVASGGTDRVSPSIMDPKPEDEFI